MNEPNCCIEGCNRRNFARGWCRVHYYRWRKYGDPQKFLRIHAYAPDAKCSVEGCDRKAEDHGMCGMHRQRVRRYGDPHYLTSELTRRLNNREAQPHLGKCKPTTYPKLFGRHEHRVMAEVAIGRPLALGEIVHHEDERKQNNSPANLVVFGSQREHASHHARKHRS